MEMIDAIAKFCLEQRFSEEIMMKMMDIVSRDYDYMSKKSLWEIYDLIPKEEKP